MSQFVKLVRWFIPSIVLYLVLIRASVYLNTKVHVTPQAFKLSLPDNQCSLVSCYMYNILIFSKFWKNESCFLILNSIVNINRLENRKCLKQTANFFNTL